MADAQVVIVPSTDAAASAFGCVFTTVSTSRAYTAAAGFEKSPLDVAGILQAMTALPASDELRADAAGTYMVEAAVSFSGPANSTVTGAVAVNGTPVPRIEWVRKLGGGGDVGAVAVAGLVVLAAADLLSVLFDVDTDGSYTTEKANLVAARVA
jgi:hypothetical protein